MEVAWPATDGNWEYADHQIKKIRTAVENGLERAVEFVHVDVLQTRVMTR